MAYRDTGAAVIDRTRDDHWAALSAGPSLVPSLPLESDDALPSRQWPAIAGVSCCPEIDCIRHLLSPIVLELAEFRAAEADVGADRVLIAWGLINEETYVTALAAWLNVEFDPLFNKPREQCPLSDDRLAEAANAGILPLAGRDGIKMVVVPRLVDSRRLVAVANAGTEVARRIRITSTARLQNFIAHHGAHDIERRAVDELRTQHPELSAGVSRARRMVILAYTALAALATIAMPGAAMTTIEILLGAIFLAWTGLRLLGLVSERFVHRQPHTFSDDWLPTYSIIVALYREAAAAPGLVAALRALDYPALGSKLT